MDHGERFLRYDVTFFGYKSSTTSRKVVDRRKTFLGGGVGIGKAVNGGFGLVLDGSKRVDDIIRRAIPWDVMGGVARRAWARNEHSIETGIKHNEKRKGADHITLPFIADEKLVEDLVADAFTKLY